MPRKKILTMKLPFEIDHAGLVLEITSSAELYLFKVRYSWLILLRYLQVLKLSKWATN